MNSYSLLLEQMEDRWIAHVVELPGCFGNGSTPDEAAADVPTAVEAYVRWRGEREPGFGAADATAELVEKVAKRMEGDYEVNAFFEADRQPVTAQEMSAFEDLLRWARESLLRSTLGLADSHLRLPLRGERWPIIGVLDHVASTENWYLDRYDLALVADALPQDTFQRLSAVRKHFLKVVPSLIGDERVVERDREQWSARKILRRALWHERDHTAHIRKMRKQLE